MTPDEARQALIDWKYHVGRRDELVWMARKAGVPAAEIADLMDLSRATVYTILGREPADNTPARREGGQS